MAGRGRVLVVGAGLAGLAAAWRLSRDGFEAAVCERTARPGGRVSSARHEDFCVDAAWPVLSSADGELLAWIAEVGLADELLPLRPVLSAQVHRQRIRQVDPRGWLGVARTPGIRPHEALRLLRLPRLLARYAAHLDPATPGRAAPLDDRSLGDFGRLYFGPTVLERWMAPLVSAHSATDPDEASRALFLRRHRADRGGRPGLPRAPLGELPEAAARRFKMLYETQVVRIERPPGARLQVILARDQHQRVQEADAVVIATSAADAERVAGPVLVAAERDFFGRVRYADGLVLAVGLRRPLHPHPLQVSVPRGAGPAPETVLVEPGVSGGRVPAGRGLALLRAGSVWAEQSAGVPDEAVAKELLGAFTDLYPRARGAVVFTRLMRQPRAHPRFDVGRYRDLARVEAVQAELRRDGRRVYFAGDYLIDPSWEGALVSARRAAEALARETPCGEAG
jgi:oxygen-dependent protoporphyrinogen oxidase